MVHKLGCGHIRTGSSEDPLDNHICHCSVCRRVTGQGSTHVVLFKHSDLEISESSRLNRQPFNDSNPDGPLELCTYSICSTPIVLDDKQKRIRVIVPNLMGYDPENLPATYHAFFDASSGAKAGRRQSCL